jgi:hypothetical protein
MELILIYPTIELVYSPTVSRTIYVSEITEYSFDGSAYHISYTQDNTDNIISFTYASLTAFNGVSVPSAVELNTIITDFRNGINPVTGDVDTPTIASYSANTTIAAGAKSVTVTTGSTYAGTILGDTAVADSIYTFTASPGNTLGAIAITRSAGSFTVIKIV